MAENRWQKKSAHSIHLQYPRTISTQMDLQIFVEKGFFHFSPILTEQAFCPRRIATGLVNTFLIDSLSYQLGNARGAQFAGSNSSMSGDRTVLAALFFALKRWPARGLILCSTARIDLALTEAANL